LTKNRGETNTCRHNSATDGRAHAHTFAVHGDNYLTKTTNEVRFEMREKVKRNYKTL